ncbi:TctA family transporter [Bradyrhizobium sp. IAR9]|nr:TctA family transporter [Bradyrhizobium sp. IAR9]
MDNLGELLHGFTIAVTVPHLVLMVVGVLLGILVGVLPGLGAPNGVSLLLPLTFGMQPVSAIILLSSMYLGGVVRRLGHLDSVQHPRRAVVGRDHFRRLSDGA